MNVKQFFKKMINLSDAKRSTESQALYFGMGSGIIACLLALWYFWGHSGVAIFGPVINGDAPTTVSIGVASIILASITSFIAYIYVVFQQEPLKMQRSTRQKVYSVIKFVALSFIHAALVFLITTIGFHVFSEAFIGATIDPYASSILTGILTGAIGYGVYLAARYRSALMVSGTLATFLVAGVLTSMITSDDPYWWQYHFSDLGTGDTASSYAFNITLIISGIVLTCVADIIANDFALLSKKNAKYATTKATIIRTLIMLIGLFLAGVGIFPYDMRPLLHNISATGMVILFLALTIGLKSFAPMLSKAFFTFTYTILAGLVVAIFLYLRVGYFDLTSFELICFVVIFSWLIVFIRQIATAKLENSPRAKHSAIQ